MASSRGVDKQLLSDVMGHANVGVTDRVQAPVRQAVRRGQLPQGDGRAQGGDQDGHGFAPKTPPELVRYPDNVGPRDAPHARGPGGRGVARPRSHGGHDHGQVRRF